ncbi:MAG: hypothetical protein VXW66_02195, partial [Pseudomonadota bacterium]|nr:hypothetical protein [Pseudomonadota bacterium]
VAVGRFGFVFLGDRILYGGKLLFEKAIIGFHKLIKVLTACIKARQDQKACQSHQKQGITKFMFHNFSPLFSSRKMAEKYGLKMTP